MQLDTISEWPKTVTKLLEGHISNVQTFSIAKKFCAAVVSILVNHLTVLLKVAISCCDTSACGPARVLKTMLINKPAIDIILKGKENGICNEQTQCFHRCYKIQCVTPLSPNNFS